MHPHKCRWKTIPMPPSWSMTFRGSLLENSITKRRQFQVLKKGSILLTSGNSGLNDETICPIGAYSNLACSGIYIVLQHRGSIIIVFDSYSYDFFCKELRHHYQWRGDSEQSIGHLSLKNTKDGGFFDVFFRNFAIGKTKTAHYEPRKPTTFVFSRL